MGGESQVAAFGAGGPESQTGLLVWLGQIHWAIHQAFHAYQFACEERRQLAVEVGALAQQLTEVLCAAVTTASALGTYTIRLRPSL